MCVWVPSVSVSMSISSCRPRTTLLLRKCGGNEHTGVGVVFLERGNVPECTRRTQARWGRWSGIQNPTKAGSWLARRKEGYSVTKH